MAVVGETAADVRLVVGNGALPDGELAALVEDTAADVRLVAGDGAIREGEFTLVEDAAAEGRITVLSRDVFDRHHCVYADVYYPSVNEGGVLTRTANRHVTVDREVFRVGPGCDIDGVARGFIKRCLDGGKVLIHTAANFASFLSCVDSRSMTASYDAWSGSNRCYSVASPVRPPYR